MSFQSFIHSFRDRDDWGSQPLQRGRRALKYALRCLLQARRQGAWLQFLQRQLPLRDELLRAQPRLYERWQHPYIHRSLGPMRRLAILRDHYTVLPQRLSSEAIGQIYLDDRLVLGQARLKDGEAIRWELRGPVGNGLEGELGLYLLDARGDRLAMLSFTVADGGRSLLVGCLQGAYAHMGAAAAREFTRQSFGLRPKNLLLSLLRTVGTVLGAQQIRAVGNQDHLAAGRQIRQRQVLRIQADYDSFWQESGGVRVDGFFQLPIDEPLRDPSQVESKHRSAFRRREALRQGIIEQTLASLGQPAPSVLPLAPALGLVELGVFQEGIEGAGDAGNEAGPAAEEIALAQVLAQEEQRRVAHHP